MSPINSNISKPNYGKLFLRMKTIYFFVIKIQLKIRKMCKYQFFISLQISIRLISLLNCDFDHLITGNLLLARS